MNDAVAVRVTGAEVDEPDFLTVDVDRGGVPERDDRQGFLGRV
jgi:hypothetical protein